ncbi:MULTISPECIES: DUF4276 family protein [unclassified Crossiella]|uniref:DUF4276 family protein n=1 Tax=unclassified Crossiella TaxID=2620835 RepID=UPI001FFE6DF1|nr:MULTISPECIES: DUF4276 family protein [unclassified Crossiella]MCK2242866.1 DUF4276 family protein [Crossiella sp. S99.2]MCK2256743.1 DUF4276 family protein [Crossiella sp. S99.1]
MSQRSYSGLFVAEGTSDLPLAGIVESLFFARGISLHLSSPDYLLLAGKVEKDIRSKLVAGVQLVGKEPDIVVVHRDSDNVDPEKRREEIVRGADAAGISSDVVPVIPVKMTEAWLLLDEFAIRQVAGNPRGRMDLGLPKIHEVESKADPKKILSECLVRAADATGRRRKTVVDRFSNHRRQLLERLDPNGAVTRLVSWQSLLNDIESTVDRWLRQS